MVYPKHEIYYMKTYLKNITLFILPIICYLFIVSFVDPFNIFDDFKQSKWDKLKKEVAGKINYPLYKLVEFQRQPTNIIILGDSRADKLNSNYIKKLTGQETANLSYGGGTLQEIIHTFWEANHLSSLKQVFIGINFNLYNDTNKRDRVEEAIILKNSYIRYLFSSYCLKSTFLILKASLFNKKPNIEKPPMNKEAFWKYQLEFSVKNFYAKYIYPKDYYQELSRISEYCTANGIKLKFFIPPTHIDLQNKIKDFNLEKEEIRFKSDLKKLGEVIDFDFPNEITLIKRNFTDPFHFNDTISKIVSDSIFINNAN